MIPLVTGALLAERADLRASLVDDLSRLARDNHLVLSIIAELHFEGIRVISVADGLDSTDEESTLAIEVRGIFNELQLRDLKKKTLRGQMGQKERGFFVGESTFGYRSVPVGEMRVDKKGRPRPEGYRMEIVPKEAAVVLRIFKAYADGQAMTKIVRDLNADNVPGRIRQLEGMVARDRQPHPRQPEVRRPMGLEQDRHSSGPEDGTAAQLREARVRVDRARRRGAADRPDEAVGVGASTAEGDAPQLAWRQG